VNEWGEKLTRLPDGTDLHVDLGRREWEKDDKGILQEAATSEQTGAYHKLRSNSIQANRRAAETIDERGYDISDEKGISSSLR
jgi:hypothetical protein